MGCHSKIARCSAVVVEVFSRIMQELLEKTSIPASVIQGMIQANGNFKEMLSEHDMIAIQTLTTDDFTKLDFILIYKIAKFFRCISEPSQSWGTKPLAHDKEIGDDVERMRVARHDLACSIDSEMTDTELNAYFHEFIEIGKRIDVHLGKPQHAGFKVTIINYMTCRIDDRLEEKYIKELREIAAEFQGNRSTDDYCAVSASQNITIAQALTFKTEADFLNEFKLEKYYPDKITVFDIIKVPSADSDKNISNIPWVYLENLVSLNFNARDKILEEGLKDFKDVSCLSGDSDEKVDFLDDLLGNDALSTTINPSDMTVAIFKCCSPMVKQVVASKMFMCRLAIPFVFPPARKYPMLISVWPIRPIVIEGEVSNKNAVDCPCNVVSFVRMGYTSVSKSRMINELISDHYHSTFFNKDCPLGSNKRWISNGLIEMAWYIPSLNSRLLSNVTVCLNLRGDSNSHKQQVKFMTHCSDAIVIMVEIRELNNERFTQLITDVYNTQVKVILAIDAIRCNKGVLRYELRNFMSRTEKFQNRTKINIMTVDNLIRSFSDLKKEMQKGITELLSGLDLLSLWQRLQKEECKQVQLDENQDVYCDMKAVADRITGCIRKMCSKTKADILPLQGEPWKKWSEKLKYVKKTSMFKSLEDHSLVENEMNEARKTQFQMCKDLGTFMKILIEAIIENLQFDTKVTVLFAWLKIYFDEQSRNILPEYLARYESKWHDLKSAQIDKVSATKIEELQQELRDHEYELAEASFGFEHLCREMGQMYEAIIECKLPVTAKLELYRKVLPQIGAKLLLLGFSLELMDGDTATVPFHWIQAVLNELKKSVDDTKILVLSVLGLQSSGKSTLLNTMFGLQFAVSAGRCTRGVYMQLVPVLDDRYPYKYVLILDTEGLRAPELGREKYKHDNELATFVVGLGDITIVNVKGENTSEVHDILQIVVHAFFRIKLANKRLNLQQKCVFVHQNVSAPDAKTNLIQQRQKFVETLDNMTKEAAGEENIRDIKTFSEVIEFDIDKNVYYFPDLWYGDPPMAPANPGYSKCVQKVKRELLLPSSVTKRQTYLTITDTISRISDLWVGILKDDFVFGFRNSLEVKAYNSMEKQCQQLKWSLEKYVFELTTSEAKIILMKCENDYDLEKSFSNIVGDFTVQIAEKMTGLCKKLDAFVEESSLKDVMIQWTETQKHTFQMQAQNLMQKANADIFNTKEEIKIQRLRERGKANHEREINELATKLAVKMQGQNPSREELEEKFDHVWKSWINNLNLKDDIEVDSIANQIKRLLHTKFHSFTAFFGDEQIMAAPLPYLKGSITVDKILEEHYRPFKNYHKIFFWIDSNLRCKIVDVINVTFNKIDMKLLELDSQDIKFNIVYVTEIMNMIMKDVDDHNDHKENHYKFDLLLPFRAMLVNHVGMHITPFFTKLNAKYNRKHSPKGQMALYKGTAWDLFISLVKQETENVIVAKFFRRAMINIIVEYVTEILPIDVQETILVRYSNSKFSLMKDIMIYLANNGSFDQYKTYIRDPTTFAKTWVTNTTNTIMFESKGNRETKYAELANSRIRSIFHQLSISIQEATDDCSRHSSLKKWLESFLRHVRISKYLPLSKDVFTHVEERKVSDIEHFTTMLLDDLKSTEKEVFRTFQKTSQRTVQWNVSPIPKIINRLWGCEEYCMFCNEPCKNTDKDHVALGFQHQCIQHRPMGINGTHKSATDKLVVEFCNYNVSTDQAYTQNKNIDTRKNYKDYKTYHPDWDILPSSDVSKYWMWFLCKYQHELAQLYDVKLPDIPKHWWDIDQDEAIKSISSTY